MAIKLASLFIEIAADGDKLTAELKKSSAQTRKWSKDIDKATTAVKRSFTVVATGAGIATGALTALYISNARSLDALGKTAAKLGDTTQDLKEFGIAATLSGVGSDQANVALQRMTRRLAEAAQGTGEAKNAIAELGLNAADLASQRPSQAFEAISSALAEIPNASDRVRLAMKFFDSEGVALVNVTRDALIQARGAVDAFGGALTTLEVSKIEQANDSITLLGVGFDLLGDKFTAKIAPAVGNVADALFQSATQSAQLEKVMDQMIVASLSGFSSLVHVAGSALRFIDGRSEIASYGVLGYLMWGKKGAALGATAGLVADTVKDSLDQLALFFDKTATDLDKTTAEIDKLESKLRLLETPGLGFLSTDKGLSDLRDRIDLFKAYAIVLADASGETVSALDETRSLTLAAADGFELLSATLDETIANYGRLSNTPAALIAPSIGTVDVSTGGQAANDEAGGYDDDYLSFLTSKQELEIEVAEDYFAYRLNAEKQFQDVWTLFQKSGAQDRLAILTNETSGALSTLAQHSRSMFEINKAVGLANATIYIAEGISHALALPFPANLAAAATVALNGAAQIATITSAKYGKGEVRSPQADGSTPTPVINVGSANSSAAANDLSAFAGGSAGGGLTIMGFHTPGASEEQKADEVAQWIQQAQDNDLLVPDGSGGFKYTGTGTSNYQRPEYQRSA